MNGRNFSEDIVIDDSASEALDQRLTLRMSSKAAEQLEISALCEGMTTGELVQRMLRDYLDQTGL